MNEFLIASLIFLFGYLINIFYISVFYHRGLAHRAVLIGPKMMKFIAITGNWVTGIDPKAWVCMHRLHHTYSDQEMDPHSPTHVGVMGVWKKQLKSYQMTLTKLIKKDKKTSQIVSDLPFEVSSMNRKKLWLIPYFTHLLIGVLLFVFSGSVWIGLGYFLGIMSHPVQGWMVNALAHRYGYQSYDCGDDSKNNTMVSLLVFGEGLQNNHHKFPTRAKFSIRKSEVDFGFLLCILASKLKIIKLQNS